MPGAIPERTFPFAAVRLTDAHNRLGQIVDDCQREPVILQKHQRARAASSAEDVEADTWADDRNDAAATPRRHSELRLPFRP